MKPMLFQLWSRLMQPEVWRFIGFASAIVGLLCYALSSSFNYLFGDWNLLKIILYSLFSFLICLVILFAKTWQHSRTLQFKVHTAFLVLTTTSLYSFFFDKVMNGKPDAYSLISCSSFAIMALSLLRRKTQCGFEADLLYFFLGCLLLQLMKIKLLLFTVGACFSYLLIVLRSCFSSVDAALDNEHPSSLQDENSLLVIEVHSDSLQQASTNTMVEEFSNYMKLLQQDNSNHVDMLLEQLKENLGDDYEYRICDPNFGGLFQLEENSNPMNDALPEETIYNIALPEETIYNIALPEETIYNIHKTAKLMFSTGFEKEVSNLYFSCRKECLVENLSRLGFKKFSEVDIQMLSLKEIEDKIDIWMKASNMALKILFPRERQLGDWVFFGFSSTNLSFMDVCKESTLELLNFADAIAIGSRSPERLFSVIDMYETMRGLIPMFEILFGDQYNGSLLKEATSTWKRLGEAIRGFFTELANLIRQDPAKAAVPGGGLHPITRYVMNYLHFASQSRHTLEQVFEEEYEPPSKEYSKIEDSVNSSSSLTVQMRLIMDLLESNLEAKSKIYEDPALYCVFLMNNSRYIVQKAEGSELGAILRDDWITKRTEF